MATITDQAAAKQYYQIVAIGKIATNRMNRIGFGGLVKMKKALSGE
jgi:hypothetical protein